LYVGKFSVATTVNFVRFWVVTAGAGAQTAEVAVYSNSSDPSGSAPATLTHLVSSGSLSSLTTTGAKQNSSGFNYTIAAGTRVWIGVRFSMATTQPAIVNTLSDGAGMGYISSVSVGALTSAGNVSGTVLTTGISVGPYLVLTT
jgi:hypothetical protein